VGAGTLSSESDGNYYLYVHRGGGGSSSNPKNVEVVGVLCDGDDMLFGGKKGGGGARPRVARSQYDPISSGGQKRFPVVGRKKVLARCGKNFWSGRTDKARHLKKLARHRHPTAVSRGPTIND